MYTTLWNSTFTQSTVEILASVLSQMLKNHLLSGTSKDTMQLNFCKVSDQSTGNCGPNAVANTFCFLKLVNPSQIQWNQALLRTNIRHSIVKNAIEFFLVQTTIRPAVYKKMNVNFVYCSCRKSANPAELTKCIFCFDFYHKSCANYDSSRQFVCERCGPKKCKY